MSRRAPADPDGQLISRTWRRIALQTAGLFAIGVVALDLLAIGFVFDAEQRDADMQLSQATNDPDALTNPPVDIVVYRLDGATLRWSPGAPAGSLSPTALRDPPAGDERVRRGDREYLVRTYVSGDATVQVGLDLTRRNRERGRLYMGLAAAGGLGVLLAGGLGSMIARHAIAPLGHAIERQQRFVANASHELRTPLTQLHTRAQLLAWDLRSEGGRSEGSPDRVRAEVEHLVRGTRQMGELVDDLLMSAQLRAEPQRYEPVALDELAREVAEAGRPIAAAAGVSIDVVAAGGADHRARGVPPALRRVLAALVDNALGHARPGGRISLELGGGPGFVEIRVRDDGEGFDPAAAELIFQRFYRGDHGNARRFGLGLALVREVVSAHGGTVTAEGSPGQGACFVIRLPSWTDRGPARAPAPAR